MHRCYTWFVAATPLSGEVPEKVIELSPWDNRGVILSVSIKCPQDLSEGGAYMFGRGANAAHRGAGGIGNNPQSGFKRSLPTNQ